MIEDFYSMSKEIETRLQCTTTSHTPVYYNPSDSIGKNEWFCGSETCSASCSASCTWVSHTFNAFDHCGLCRCYVFFPLFKKLGQMHMFFQ